MKTRPAVSIVLTLSVVAVVGGLWLFARNRPNRILRRMSCYYESLSSFEGVNTTVTESGTYRITSEKRFAFQRPNRFVILLDTNTAWRWYCDGTNFYEYQPQYYNSYTRMPAPPRYTDVITNRIGGELLLMILATNRIESLMSGFGHDVTALMYDGQEVINGIDCDRLHFQGADSNTVDLWVARGAIPYAVRCAYSFQSHFSKTNQAMRYTETISSWQGNGAIPPSEFVFMPPNGAIERPAEDDQVELSEFETNGTKKEIVKFYSSQKAADEAKGQAEFLKKNESHFREVALSAILSKYRNLAASDLQFKDVEQSSDGNTGNDFDVTFILSNTIKETETAKSVQTSEETVVATLSAAGNVEHVGRGTSVKFRSK